MTIFATDLKALRKTLFDLRVNCAANTKAIDTLNAIDRLLPQPPRVTSKRWIVTYNNKALGSPDDRTVFLRGTYTCRDDASADAAELNASGNYVCVQVQQIEVEVPDYE